MTTKKPDICGNCGNGRVEFTRATERERDMGAMVFAVDSFLLLLYLLGLGGQCILLFEVVFVGENIMNMR